MMFKLGWRLPIRALAWVWAVVWLSGLAGVAPAHAGAEFLPPDQAFRLEAKVIDGQSVGLRWVIEPGYYLYRERMGVQVTPAAVQSSPVVFPPGQVKFDENFQKNVETYHDGVETLVRVGSAPDQFRLAVSSQGCADQGLCYPPRVQMVRVSVQGDRIARAEILNENDEGWTPDAQGALRALVPGAVQVNSNANSGGVWGLARGGWSGFENTLRGGSLWQASGLFLLAGLLLAFTPCVLPMVPILSSIVVGQGGAVSRGRALSLSLSYALGMAMVYTAMGVAAGLAGEGLAAALQTPGVLTLFAVLLGVLSLSMFGLYEFQLPSSWQSGLSAQAGRLGGGRLGAVFAMGGVSALIVGPCVAAPLAGVLLYISQTRDVVLGGVALFSMAVGMSVPLVLVGASAGALLPKAGRWMDGVKRLFGLMLLAVALWMVSPVWPTWAIRLGLGVWCVVAAWAIWPSGPHRNGRSPGRWLAGAVAVVGLALAVGWAPWQQTSVMAEGRRAGEGTLGASETAGASKAVTFRRIKTEADLEAIVAQAGRPVMLDFYADWCVSCKEFERFTFTDPRVRAMLDGAVLVQADVTANDANDKALLKRFQLFGPPGIIFFDAQGRELSEQRVIGFQDADAFVRSLDAVGL